MEMQAQSVPWWRTGLGKVIARLFGGLNRPVIAGKTEINLAGGKTGSGNKSSEFWSDFARKADSLAEPDEIRSSEADARTAILVPVDFSTSSFRALDCGLRLARKACGELILLHVVHLNLTPYGPGNPEWLKAALRREASGKAEAVADRIRESGVLAQCLIEEGSPAEVIPRIAAQKDAQIIVMASPKRSPAARLFRQKTVEHVIHNVQCPVLVLQTNLKEGIL